jgi:hypothetical protein
VGAEKSEKQSERGRDLLAGLKQRRRPQGDDVRRIAREKQNDKYARNI